jgi:hypothetical protein
VKEDFRIKSSVLADLGPLPEAVESNSETLWQAFLQLQAQNPTTSSRATSPFTAPEEVMAQARRFNRICPVESEWLRLQAILADCGEPDPPYVVQGAAFRRMPALAKRMALRDVVDWAAERGCLMEVHAFLDALPEDGWTHMGD